MLSIVKATALAVMGLALVPALARAQDQTSPIAQPAPASGIGTETRLPALVVSATRSERTLADQPMSVTVVPREQILETPAQALDDVLRTTVGINLPLITSYQIHPTGNSFSMRGLGGIRGLVMLDGVPINDPFFGYVQWNRVPMENIERVEVVRGASASMWGNYAMGGVVNIITRKPERTAFAATGAAAATVLTVATAPPMSCCRTPSRSGATSTPGEPRGSTRSSRPTGRCSRRRRSMP